MCVLHLRTLVRRCAAAAHALCEHLSLSPSPSPSLSLSVRTALGCVRANGAFEYPDVCVFGVSFCPNFTRRSYYSARSSARRGSARGSARSGRSSARSSKHTGRSGSSTARSSRSTRSHRGKSGKQRFKKVTSCATSTRCCSSLHHRLLPPPHILYPVVVLSYARAARQSGHRCRL